MTGRMDQEQYDDAIKRVGNLLDNTREKICKEYDSNYRDSITEIWDRIKDYSTEHPLITACLLITVGLSAIPVTCFATFAVGSMIITFMGFAVLEGILLSIGMVVLGIALCITGFFALAFCSFFLSSWYALDSSRKLLEMAKQKMEYKQASADTNGMKSTPVSNLEPENVDRKEEVTEKE